METIKLDLIPGKKMPSLHASQYDDGRDYHIDLTENRVPYVLDGTETISLTVRKCDNTLAIMDIANTFADKSYIEFRTTEQMNACAGFNYGEITIEKNGTQISSLNFYLQVEGAPDEGGITSQSEINNLKRQVHDAVVEELEDNGASETGYDNTESGLEATNVQDAIDEVNAKIENIPSVDAYTKEETDDKFATKKDLENIVDDNVISDKRTYSSEKISELIAVDNKKSGTIVTFEAETEKPLFSLKADIDYKAGGVNKVNVNYVNANQFANPKINITQQGLTIPSMSESGVCEISGTTTSTYSSCFININVTENDIWYMKFKVHANPNNLPIRAAFQNVTGVKCYDNTPAIYKMPSTRVTGVGLEGMDADTDYTGVKFTFIAINITQLLGSAKADYLFALTDNGLAILNKLLYKDYYPANAGGNLVSLASLNGDDYPCVSVDISDYSIYGGSIVLTPTGAVLTSTKNADGTDKTTPVEYNITGQFELVTLIGLNIFFADSGDIECSYFSLNCGEVVRGKADQAYVDEKFNEINNELSEKAEADATATKYQAEALSDANCKNTYTRNRMIRSMIEGSSRTTQSTTYNELLEGTKAVIDRHTAKTPDLIRLAVITDEHRGGTRTNTYYPDYNIAAFIALANSKADMAINLGDMITNYYDETYMNGLPMAAAEEDAVHDMFASLTVPYFIAKGNHDIGVNGFSVTETPSVYRDGLFGIDIVSGSIYRITEENFATYLASGNPFYVLSGYTYFTNQEIQEICLVGYCQGAVFNNLDPYGFYYYYDFNSKLRIIVLNDFYNINDGGGSGGNSRSPYETAWLTSVLTDALANDLPVLTISHTEQVLTTTAIKNAIDTFTNGGGVYLGHLHGHNHADIYSNSSGYNNIGVNASLIYAPTAERTNYTCRYTGYVFDMIEIDIANKLIYEIRTGEYNDKGSGSVNLIRSEDRVFSFETHEQLV